MCCVGVGTAQGGILAACWAPRLLLSLLLEEKPTLYTPKPLHIKNRSYLLIKVRYMIQVQQQPSHWAAPVLYTDNIHRHKTWT